MRQMNIIAILAAALLLTAALTAPAQNIKKYITPDGQTIYSDKPVPGAREVGTVAPPKPIDPNAASRPDETTREDPALAREAERRAQEREAQQAQLQAAQAQLEQARSALANGREPLPGERIGLAGGGSRLTDAYHRRQAANEEAVRQAEQYLETLRERLP